MDNAEAQLREIQLALKYCDLDYEAILEDYREHVREKQNQNNREKQLTEEPGKHKKQQTQPVNV